MTATKVTIEVTTIEVTIHTIEQITDARGVTEYFGVRYVGLRLPANCTVDQAIAALETFRERSREGDS